MYRAECLQQGRVSRYGLSSPGSPGQEQVESFSGSGLCCVHKICHCRATFQEIVDKVSSFSSCSDCKPKEQQTCFCSAHLAVQQPIQNECNGEYNFILKTNVKTKTPKYQSDLCLLPHLGLWQPTGLRKSPAIWGRVVFTSLFTSSAYFPQRQD